MTKVMIINGVWSTIVCTMIAFGALIYTAHAAELTAGRSYSYDFTASDIE